MTSRYLAATALALLWAGSAHAGDKPIYAPAPAWVKPAPPIDGTKLTDASPVLLLFDQQQTLEKGKVWAYIDSATRASTTEVLNAIGTIQYPWQPGHGDLIIHKVEIIRGAEHIDLLHGTEPFTVLRREQQLNERILDGTLTATMPVPGLRVGDVLHVAISIVQSDETLKGRVQSGAAVVYAPFRVDFARVRMRWPVGDDVHWKAYSADAIAAPTVADGYRELTVALPLAKQADLPTDAPGRFKNLPVLEVSSFSDWAQVSATMAPLYATEGLIDPKGPIAAEVNRIMAAESDPLKRAAAALQVVQDKIRYQLVALGTGNYVPQTPAQTWTVRYGDCKAKTLLLLAMLHAMGIEAEPVLSNVKLNDYASVRLPSAGAFDHIFVQAMIGGEPIWLDGTGSGTRLADLHDVPHLNAILPVRAAGATLMPLPKRFDARPTETATIDIDSTAGVSLPAPFKISIVARGAGVAALKFAVAQGSKEDQDKIVTTAVRTYLDGATVDNPTIAFDDAAATATVTATGIAYPAWSKSDDRLKTVIDNNLSAVSFDPDRGRPAWRDIPVATPADINAASVMRIKLPQNGAGFAVEGDQTLDIIVAGQRVTRAVTLQGGIVTVTTSRASRGDEIAPAAIADERKRLAAANARAVRAVAPADYPAMWQQVADAGRTHKLDPIVAVYTARIAQKPDDAERYTDRAWFYERVYDRPHAIADLTKAIALSPTADVYERRATLYAATRDWPKVMADATAAVELDPKAGGAIGRIARTKAETGDVDGAIALLQEHVDEGGENKIDYIAALADLEADFGRRDDALSTLTAAIAKNTGQPALLNSRCWVRGTQNTELEAALKDCTKAIELADSASSILDSRAMVYFRMNRPDDALADLNAALELNPDQAGSLFMRGIIRKQQGDLKAATSDLNGARLISPTIDFTYKRYGISAGS